MVTSHESGVLLWVPTLFLGQVIEEVREASMASSWQNLGGKEIVCGKGKIMCNREKSLDIHYVEELEV